MQGFDDGSTSGSSSSEFAYDANGNMYEDLNKNIDIEYNHLNLPEKVYFPDWYNCSRLLFDYDAAGNKVRMLVEQNCGSQSNPNCTVEEEIHYVGNFVYVDNTLAYILNGHGRIVKSSSTFIYEYFITDHLGNVRVVFNEEGTSGANPKQYADYYPFGMRFTGTYLNNDNRYLYNSKEWEDDFELNWYDYGARFYDPAVGRWHTPDPVIDFEVSPFNYVGNDPVNFTDPFGLYRRQTYYGGIGGGGGKTNYLNSDEPSGPPTLYNQCRYVHGNMPRPGPSFEENMASKGYVYIVNQYGIGTWVPGGDIFITTDPEVIADLWAYLSNTYFDSPVCGIRMEGNSHNETIITLQQFYENYKGKNYLEIITERQKNMGLPGGPDLRYVINPNNGQIMDMRHVMVVGYGSTMLFFGNPALGYTVGLGVEVAQWFGPYIGYNTRGSAFNRQDFYSNRIGVNFATYYLYSGQFVHNDWTTSFYNWLKN